MNYFTSTFVTTFYDWALTHGAQILFIVLAMYLARRFGYLIIDQVVKKAIESQNGHSAESKEKRQQTLSGVFHSAFNVLVWVFGVLMLLSEVGINIGPLLAGAGIVGLALGFGGQYLIRDVIAGMFIIFENQFRVGDVVSLDGTSGLVEEITLRKTRLRDLDGTVHHIPNGEIKRSSNLSKSFARINMNIGVSYNSDLEKVIRVVNETGQQLAEDPVWKDIFIKPAQFLRVDDFGDSAVIVKILGETKPLKQWDAAGELRKRLKTAFDKHGIEIPFPQRVVHTSGDID